MSEPKPTYLAAPSKPSLKLPKGSWDCHCHIFGPGSVFPYDPTAAFKPHDAPKEKLFALYDHIGITHSVIVNSSSHGYDNRVAEDALVAKKGAYRAVALAPTDVSDAELKRLDGIGFRGCRFHYMGHLRKGSPIEEVIKFAKRLEPIGWHLQIHLEGGLIAEMTPALKRSPVPVVIDHIGRVDASAGLEQPAFKALLALMGDKKVWTKVSGCDRITRQGPPYADAVPFAHKLVSEFTDRVVWGTDWPHPNHAPPIPDDGGLVDLIGRLAPSEAQRQALMVDNPRRLYRWG